MNESQICLFFAKLLRTVEALHHLHISHEDIKRANVLVSPDTRTKGLVYPVLADFGFSHFNPSGGFVTSLGGTFDYSSPQKIAVSFPVRTERS
jgi:serine/threonine protein kinase